MKNERTGKKAASIAGRILHLLEINKHGYGVWICTDKEGDQFCLCTVKELKAVLASALTQAPDRPKRKK